MRAVFRGLWAVWVGLCLAGCDGGGLGHVEAGFRVGSERLEFGKALVGERVVRELEIIATGRGSVAVVVEATAPFEAPASVELPGGGSTRIPVTWRVTPDRVEGLLTLTARGESVEVPLTGRGIVPETCVPSAQCRKVRFDLDAEQCVEVVSDDGAACTPDSLCLENGVCREGVCVGTPRSCDDGNVCTQDACSPAVGCVHTDVSSSCPRPENPCEVATCDPVGGCGVELRGDGVVCGAADCVTVNLCQSGTCQPFPTPEGFLCSPRTPCQGEGRCSQGECVRPDAGTLEPDWSVALGPVEADGGAFAPEKSPMGVEGGNVFFTGCGLDALDGGCALSSYTPNGFLRFDAPLDGGGVFAGTSGPVAAVVQSGGLQAFLATTGAPLWSLPLAALPPPVDGGVPALSPRGVALDPDGALWAAVRWSEPVDGGGAVSTLLHVAPDGGLLRAEPILLDAGAPELLALPASGAVSLYDPAGPLACFEESDGGTGYAAIADHPGAAVLSGSDARLMPGGDVLLDADGGLVQTLIAPDAGEASLGMEVLAAGGRGFVFFRGGPERNVLLRVFDLQTGTPQWEITVLPGGVRAQVVEASVLGGPLANGVVTLTEAFLDDGLRSDVQLFVDGERAMLCPLEGSPRVRGGVFAPGRLFAIVEREGVWRLEAYDLASLPLADTGWPRPGGIGGARRER